MFFVFVCLFFSNALSGSTYPWCEPCEPTFITTLTYTYSPVTICDIKVTFSSAFICFRTMFVSPKNARYDHSLRLWPPSQKCSEWSHCHVQQAGVVLVTCEHNHCPNWHAKATSNGSNMIKPWHALYNPVVQIACARKLACESWTVVKRNANRHFEETFSSRASSYPKEPRLALHTYTHTHMQAHTHIHKITIVWKFQPNDVTM